MGYEMTKEQGITIDLIAARMDANLTNQQKEFACDFTVPTISFSDPGSGKTLSALGGIIMAQTFHKVPGRKINAMSFTRMATAEFAAKYEKACKKCSISPTATFNTFHSICNSILGEALPGVKIKHGIVFDKDLPVLQNIMEEEGFPSEDMYYVRRVLDCINSLNSALQFDVNNVVLSARFIKLDMPFDVFQGIRRRWFVRGLLTKVITQGDIPIYALYQLLLSEKLCNKYKDMYDIMIVDEFQDMSLLHLKILSLISKNLIAIGDMKQQIYGFNGSSQQIVEEYMKMYPEARNVNLTQSFRCKNEISEFSTGLIKPNDISVEPFQGTGDGGAVAIHEYKDLDLPALVSMVKEEQSKIGYGAFVDTMFLFRNNYSATPIAEELYRQGVLFRMNRFTKVMDIPIFKELCMMADISVDDKAEASLANIPKIMPEFKQFNQYNCPVILAVRQSGVGLLDLPYHFKDQSSIDIITAMKKARLCIQQDKSSSVVLNCFLNVFEQYIIEGKWWKLDYEKEFYFDLVSPVIREKSYKRMVYEEYEKERKIQHCTSLNTGVRCYTVHSGKGLEADVVYLLDAEAGIFPSAGAIKRYLNMDCSYEVAKEIRNERNLLYVAVTRAKEKVVITYKDSLSGLIASPMDNEYTYLDEVYMNTPKEFDDVGEFKKLFNFK